MLSRFRAHALCYSFLIGWTLSCPVFSSDMPSFLSEGDTVFCLVEEPRRSAMWPAFIRAILQNVYPGGNSVRVIEKNMAVSCAWAAQEPMAVKEDRRIAVFLTEKKDVDFEVGPSAISIAVSNLLSRAVDAGCSNIVVLMPKETFASVADSHSRTRGCFLVPEQFVWSSNRVVAIAPVVLGSYTVSESTVENHALHRGAADWRFYAAAAGTFAGLMGTGRPLAGEKRGPMVGIACKVALAVRNQVLVVDHAADMAAHFPLTVRLRNDRGQRFDGRLGVSLGRWSAGRPVCMDPDTLKEESFRVPLSAFHERWHAGPIYVWLEGADAFAWHASRVYLCRTGPMEFGRADFIRAGDGGRDGDMEFPLESFRIERLDETRHLYNVRAKCRWKEQAPPAAAGGVDVEGGEDMYKDEGAGAAAMEFVFDIRPDASSGMPWDAGSDGQNPVRYVFRSNPAGKGRPQLVSVEPPAYADTVCVKDEGNEFGLEFKLPAGGSHIGFGVRLVLEAGDGSGVRDAWTLGTLDDGSVDPLAFVRLSRGRTETFVRVGL